MDAFFILGTQRDIARAEIQTIVGDVTTVVDVEDVLIVGGFSGNLTVLQNQLGGVVKTGVIHASAKDQDELIDVLTSLIATLRPGDTKIKFGVSVYHGGHRGKLTALRTQSERIGLKVKNALKAQERSARLVTSKIPVLSSVIVKKQKLMEEGIEFCLFPQAEGILVGITESVQDFEEWGARDFGRPERHTKRGMLPPKLARSMINLAGGNVEDTLLDPFCGVGTVLTEALALGYKHLIGSDVDPLAAEATRVNVAWESERTGVEADTRILQTKAEAIGTFVAPKSVNLIVTEVFLGKPRTGHEDRISLEKQLDQLLEIYTDSFRAFTSILTEGAKVVIALPAYVVNGTVIEPRFVERAQLFGFELLPFKGVETTRFGALRYGREDQLVLRDIYRFTFKQ
ncbi:hypothetical protein COV06_02110 [Candidatus Uhrbacteria bacterium CG10_big_fil_rev_8_21_14_0_10_50_16]|uniref:Ribosomal RNA large subunit methyltransferase K/L-like methyltransferase domain-containing protein n=1 Tax=Candidatus Uhrbacteria bacterium CG10_big_fil_rev_8_21_14_0_10_50_16 TaxID=1975039 RepID=A0A2H0RMU9_9BACT|nr:MAG: hypothetical protein COV06_02110 [Candidatus Uhrbacteria bacterium CG10_big_fil_rev_8_21_14_0_10_50_16]